MSERRHGHLSPLAFTCMSTSLLPSVIYDFWCTCVFLRCVLLCGGVIFYFAALRLRFHGFKETFSPYLTCMSTSLVPSVFYYFWCTCVFLSWRPPVGWSQVLLSCIEVDTHAASSMAVEKYFLLTCMRISLFPNVFYDIWCSCVSFLGGVLLCGGVKCHWGASRSTCAASSRH